MFATRELTGEVDHSFFDSDCENGSFVKDGEKCDTDTESDHSAEGDWRSPPLSRHLHAANGQLAESLDPGGSREAGGKDHRNGSELKPISQTSSMSSIDRHLAKLIRNDSDDDDEVSSVTSEQRPDETVEAECKETDDDGYHQSQDESEGEEDERLPSSRRHSGLNGGNLGTPKKLLRKRHPRVPSPASSDAGTDTEADRFSVSSHESCSLEAPAQTSPKTSQPSSPPRVRKPGSCSGCRHSPQTASESGDTVTNVTPLSTPDLSPHRVVDLSPRRDVDESENENENVKERQEARRQERVPSSASSNNQQGHKDYDDDLDEHSVGSQTQLEGPLFFDVPHLSSRKNFSFRNDEVRSIDRENRRLLRELSRQSSRSAASSATRGKINSNNPPPIRLYHSAVNRQREQQRIEKENLAFLKRLESVKPTPGLRRLDQLADYQRQAAYMGASHIIYATTPERDRPTTRTPIGKCPSLTSVGSNNSSRATHDSGKKPGVTRPAWVS